MKRCLSCFRCVEYAGFKFRLGEFHFKPRKDWPVKCIAADRHDDFITQDSQVCKSYYPRWRYNLEILWIWRIAYKLYSGFCKYIRVPLGGLKEPVPLRWKDYYDCARDTIIPDGEPECPRCGEMPYNSEQCVFCGQRFREEGDEQNG